MPDIFDLRFHMVPLTGGFIAVALVAIAVMSSSSRAAKILAGASVFMAAALYGVIVYSWGARDAAGSVAAYQSVIKYRGIMTGQVSPGEIVNRSLGNEPLHRKRQVPEDRELSQRLHKTLSPLQKSIEELEKETKVIIAAPHPAVTAEEFEALTHQASELKARVDREIEFLYWIIGGIGFGIFTSLITAVLLAAIKASF